MTGASTTTGITNTGDITNSGLTKTGTLNVTGLSTTTGITNTGAITNTGDISNTGKFTNTGDTKLGTANNSQITIGAANGSSTVTIPGIASGGDAKFVTTDSNGVLGSSQYTINQYNQALQSVDSQIESVGAMAAALSAIPAITTGDKKFACGIGTGAFGSTWAGAVGCVGKLSTNVWMNGALSFTPSVDTAFGSTPSVGGRLGLFFQF